MVASAASTLRRTPPNTSISQLESKPVRYKLCSRTAPDRGAATAPWPGDPTAFPLERLREYDPDTSTVGHSPAAVAARTARASRIRACAWRRSRLEATARVTRLFRSGSLKVVHHCVRSAGPEAVPSAPTSLQ